MSQLYIAIAVTAAVLLTVGFLSNALKRRGIQEPLAAVLVGVAVGPVGLGWLSADEWGADQLLVIEEAARITLAIGLMGVALRIERGSLSALARPAVILLTFGLVGMWAMPALAVSVVASVPIWIAVLIGAAVTPTDPVVASSIVSGNIATESLPRRLRDLISLESGANDGLASAFVILPVLVLQSSVADSIANWIVHSLILDTLGALASGAAIGFASARLMVFAEKRKYVEQPSLLGYSLAFTMLTLALVTIAGMHALLAVFTAGLVFNMNTPSREEHVERNVQEAAAKLLTLPMFVLFGVVLPIDGMVALGWALPVLILLILVARRPPVVLALGPLLGQKLDRNDIMFLAWNGPIGVAAIYYAANAARQLGEPIIWHITASIVLGSIVVHGVTAKPTTLLYRRLNGRSKVTSKSA